MIQLPKKYQIAHFSLRIITLGLLVYSILALLSKTFFHALRRISPFTASFEANFIMASTFVLPFLVFIEMIWMYREKSERLALGIDFIITLVWFVFFWTMAFYALTHYTFL